MVPPVILLIFLLTVDLGDTSCFQVDFPSTEKDVTKVPFRESKIHFGCFMDNHLYAQGRRWRTKDCQDCLCFKQHMTCCLIYLIPTVFDRENCVDIFDQKTCTTHIVRKSNPAKKCEILGALG